MLNKQEDKGFLIPWRQKVDLKHNSALVDNNLINVALILSNKSTKINKAVHEICLDIESFNSWLKS